MLAMEAEGRQITTVEGLGTPNQMNEVQKAFVKHDAQQCGFCTPGSSSPALLSFAKIPMPPRKMSAGGSAAIFVVAALMRACCSPSWTLRKQPKEASNGKS